MAGTPEKHDRHIPPPRLREGVLYFRIIKKQLRRTVMHIPENYLSPATCAVMTAAMVPVWVHSVKKVKEEELVEELFKEIEAL